MKKVIIIGSGGAGKSTFARRLHEATGIELIHLDKLYWKPNWVETPKSEWKQLIGEIIRGEEWILDGNFGGTMEMRLEACDTVILLDMPRIICVYQALKRIATYRKGQRPDMGEGCDERFDIKFLSWIWNYPSQTKPKIEKLLEQYGSAKNVIRLRSKRDIEDFFYKISSSGVN